jgi:uncharacterized protein YidB (DUF937 family)
MGLLDTALGMLGGSQSEPDQPGNSQPALLQTVLAMLSNNSGEGGGLGGLIGQFNNAGLGNIVSSWIGTGENLPISAQQIQDALGGHLGQVAESTGMSQGDTAQQLSQLLPGLVDKLTPNGELPQEGGDLGGLGNIGAILGQFTSKT